MVNVELLPGIKGAENWISVSPFAKAQVKGPAVEGAHITTPSEIFPAVALEKVIVLSMKQAN